MRVKNLTVGQLEKACSENSFIILRTASNGQYGFNCKIRSLSKIKKGAPYLETNYIGFKPCSFNEYISFKVPFILK